jgi:hypothetical protein
VAHTGETANKTIRSVAIGEAIEPGSDFFMMVILNGEGLLQLGET